MVTQLIKIQSKKKSQRRSQFLKKRGGGPARYDHDHRFNGFLFTPYLIWLENIIFGWRNYTVPLSPNTRRFQLYTLTTQEECHPPSQLQSHFVDSEQVYVGSLLKTMKKSHIFITEFYKTQFFVSLLLGKIHSKMSYGLDNLLVFSVNIFAAPSSSKHAPFTTQVYFL